jgi:hypothetical protein
MVRLYAVVSMNRGCVIDDPGAIARMAAARVARSMTTLGRNDSGHE